MTVPVRMMRAFYGACRGRGLDEDARRDLMERETGKRSAKALTTAEMSKVLNVLNGRTGHKSGPKKVLRDTPHIGKLRALWISGWHLGVIRDDSDAALAAFVAAQTGIDALKWLPSDDAFRAIEALKAWLDRDAGVDWPQPSATPLEHRMAVIEAQWRVLIELDVLEVNARPLSLTDREADQMIRDLGRKLRAAQRKANE